MVAASELDVAVSEWARKLAAGPPLALSMSKSLLVEGMTASMEQMLESEARALAVNIQSADCAEAMEAFKSKRAPVFQGR